MLHAACKSKHFESAKVVIEHVMQQVVELFGKAEARELLGSMFNALCDLHRSHSVETLWLTDWLSERYQLRARDFVTYASLTAGYTRLISHTMSRADKGALKVPATPFGDLGAWRLAPYYCRHGMAKELFAEYRTGTSRPSLEHISLSIKHGHLGLAKRIEQYARRIPDLFDLSRFGEIAVTMCGEGNLRALKWIYRVAPTILDDKDDTYRMFRDACLEGHVTLAAWLAARIGRVFTNALLHDEEADPPSPIARCNVLCARPREDDYETRHPLFWLVCVDGSLPMAKWLVEKFSITKADLHMKAPFTCKTCSHIDDAEMFTPLMKDEKEEPMLNYVLGVCAAEMSNTSRTLRWMLRHFSVTAADLPRGRAVHLSYCEGNLGHLPWLLKELGITPAQFAGDTTQKEHTDILIGSANWEKFSYGKCPAYNQDWYMRTFLGDGFGDCDGGCPLCYLFGQVSSINMASLQWGHGINPKCQTVRIAICEIYITYCSGHYRGHHHYAEESIKERIEWFAAHYVKYSEEYEKMRARLAQRRSETRRRRGGHDPDEDEES